MREATGEANLTTITIVLIGVILGVFYFIIPQIMNGIKNKACCISNNGEVNNGKCIIKAGHKRTSETSFEEYTTEKPLSEMNKLCKAYY